MKRIIFLLLICVTNGCTKKLDLKPDSSIVLPESVQDLEMILDNTDKMNNTLGLAHISADEYIIPSLQIWNSLRTITSRNASIWEKDIYGGETKISDWTTPYGSIYYCNNVLEILSRQDISTDIEKKKLKGWALFGRSYAFYSLVSTFCKAFDRSTASSELGMPLKLKAGIDEIVPRSSLKDSYDQIISDAMEAAELLQQDIIPGKRTRPSKVAAFAFLARVYLSMRTYDKAELYADKTLTLYSKLTDFNTLSKTSNSFNYDSEEIIYFTRQITTYSQLTSAAISNTYGVNPELIGLYSPYDLRIPIYFQKNTSGNFNLKRINSLTASPFTGLATDEIYLIKAECLARRGETQKSMDFLNQLAEKRWNPNAKIPVTSFQPMTATSPDVALDKILIERRKALVWRSLRWTDLKRLNMEGRNITITRKLDDKTYTLLPNSPRYILPIPDDEVSLSGVQQNER